MPNVWELNPVVHLLEIDSISVRGIIKNLSFLHEGWPALAPLTPLNIKAVYLVSYKLLPPLFVYIMVIEYI